MKKILNIVIPSALPVGIIVGLLLFINSICGDNKAAKVFTVILFSPAFLYTAGFVQETVNNEIKKG